MRKALFILGDLSDSDIDWLAAVGRKEAFTEGSILIREGEPSADVYILLKGRLSVRVMSRGAEEINVMHPGEFIGELSFLDSRPPSATVAAAARSIVAAISREALRAKLERDTAFAARFYRALGIFLAHRLRRMTVQTRATDALASSASRSDDEDEIDPDLLESVSLAANRFEWLKSRFGSE